MKCKHTFDLVAESNQANHYWCELCGAYKRVPIDGDGKTEIGLPKVGKTKLRRRKC